MYRYNRIQNPTQDWRTMRKYLQLAAKTLQEDGPIMTQIERVRSEAEFKDLQTQYVKAIYQGTAGDFQAAIGKVKDARGKVARARQAEADRFNLPKLIGEMQALDFLTNQVLKNQGNVFDGSQRAPVDTVKKLYQDASGSGDIHRQRAAAEIISKVDITKVTDTELRSELNTLVHRASRDLATLRNPPEIGQAQQEELQATEELAKAYNELKESNKAVNGGETFDPGMPTSDFEKIARLVAWEESGPRLVDPTSAEYTGVYWKEELPTAGG